MQYMLLISTRGARPDDARGRAGPEVMQRRTSPYTEELRELGRSTSPATRSSRSTTAKSVQRPRRRDPIAPTARSRRRAKLLGGYYLIDVDSDEEAQSWAAKIPVGTRSARSRSGQVVVFPTERRLMKYLALIYSDERRGRPLRATSGRRSTPATAAFADDRPAAGKLVGGLRAGADGDRDDRARPSTARRSSPTARSPRRKEQLGGYFILECGSVDEALELAAQIPARGHGGAVEVGRATPTRRRRRHEVRCCCSNERRRRRALEGAQRGGGARARAPRRSRSGCAFDGAGGQRPSSSAWSSTSPTRPRSCASATARRSSPTGPTRRRRSSSAAASSVECDDLDEAIELAASKIPVASRRLGGDPAARRASDRPSRSLFREEWGRAVAVLARVLGDLALAEDAVQDAFAAALERWPRDGPPANPAAWIVTTARNRAIDRIRRERTLARKTELLGATRGAAHRDEEDDVSAIPDDRLEPHLRVLPSGARARGARGADAARGRRA